jgi:UDP-GlcNAc:undecaprenyl-phosphate GlcNAc-1-phosphate transferase
MIHLDRPVQTAVLGFLLAAIIVYVLTPVMSRIAHRAGVVDTPTDDRRMHLLATPLLGGMAIFFGFIISTLVLVRPLDRATQGILIGGTIITLVGLIDDAFEIRPLLKFVGQLVAIGVAVSFDMRVTHMSVPFMPHVFWMPGWVSIVFTVVWVAAIINMVNFIDGLDGLAAGICAISALTFSVIALSMNRGSMGIIAAILGGSTFAFLRFNFYPASIFMGDAGSMLLGFILGVISVQSVMKSTATIALVLPLLVLGVPFVDLFMIVWRRWRKGVPFYTSGQDHMHHDLVLVVGFSQRKSVLLLYGWCLMLNGLAIAMRLDSLPAIIVLAVGAVVATAYMAQLLSKYRSGTAPPGDDDV